VRIASWNVDSIRARAAAVGRWIDANRPDVICFQETKVSDRLFPRSLLADRGYELALAGSGGQGGVAVASRRPLGEVVIGIPGAAAPLDELRTISVDVGDLRVHTLYGPNGRKVGSRHHEIKLAWLELFRAWVEMDGLGQGRPTVVIGDLNIAPTDLDVWDAGRYRSRNLTSPRERASFERLVETGLVDVVRQHNPDRRLYSWWNRRGDFYLTDRGWRLDHALCDPGTAETVQAAWIDRDERGREGASDHAPVVIDLTD
jgi:exodeoxyribonuclease-3